MNFQGENVSNQLIEHINEEDCDSMRQSCSRTIENEVIPILCKFISKILMHLLHQVVNLLKFYKIIFFRYCSFYNLRCKNIFN